MYNVHKFSGRYSLNLPKGDVQYVQMAYDVSLDICNVRCIAHLQKQYSNLNIFGSIGLHCREIFCQPFF
jgi:hypothetical protein